MNINFHYCAVKAIAVIAGLSAGEAQVLATYSQFVDDFKVDKSLSLTNVPDYCAPLIVDGKFHTVPTGFGYASTLLSKTQREVVMPFHFIPNKKSNPFSEEYRTVEAKAEDNSLIDQICAGACEQFGRLSLKESLITLGTALHVFADTYAHCLFNAFNSNINAGKVKTAKSNLDEKRSYSKYSGLPPIGHARLGSAPDESDLEYTFNYGQEEDVKRTNWVHFAECAVQIVQYLGRIRGLQPSRNLDEKVRNCVMEGSKIKGTDMGDLQRKWQKADPLLASVSFSYVPPKWPELLHFDSGSLPDGVSANDLYAVLEISSEEEEKNEGRLSEAARLLPHMKATATAEFYRYNFAAYSIRKEVLS